MLIWNESTLSWNDSMLIWNECTLCWNDSTLSWNNSILSLNDSTLGWNDSTLDLNDLLAISGPTNTCPAVVNQRSNPQNIFQNGNICYEYVALSKAWLEAQNYCNTTGGHLVSIENQGQQTFISNMLSQLSVVNPVWLGLNDRLNEEHWVLDTGRYR